MNIFELVSIVPHTKNITIVLVHIFSQNKNKTYTQRKQQYEKKINTINIKIGSK